MKNKCTSILLLVFLFSVAMTHGLHAQNVVFRDVSENSFAKSDLKRLIVPRKYRTIKLDTVTLTGFLKNVPSEKTPYFRNNSPVLSIPLPDGKSARFRVWETQVMAPELAAQFPNIKTYSGQGIDDPTATITIDMSESGFHAMILSPVSTSVFIDPYDSNTKTNYISYFKSDFDKGVKFVEKSPLVPKKNKKKVRSTSGELSVQSAGTQLRTYRLVIACTGEYAKAATGLLSPTVSQTMAKIVTSVNRVDGVYEKEFSIRLQLVANNSAVVFTNPATDPFNGNSNASLLIDESQTVIDNLIGSANYDIGHTFSTDTEGYADMGVVCYDFDGYDGKAMGVTGIANPVGDPYDIDYVSHEIGHQFGADHTFNSEIGGCYNQGSNLSNAEPGSGSTIMAYAALCDNLSFDDNLQYFSDPYFHTLSFDAINTYVSTGDGSICPVVTSTGNTPPTVNAGADYVIPKSTPFILTGSANDADGDAITYCWEQVDVGAPFSKWNAPSGNMAPIFRSFLPVTVPYRYFPRIEDVINGTSTIGEIKPSYARPLNFSLTARDNKAGGGGVNFDDMLVTVNSNGPFTVSYPTATGITWAGGETRTVTWNVSNTNISPISTANVTIQLSTDGGYTYPVTLVASTANDGSENITVPNIATTSARIRVMAVGNIFYNISQNNFTITFTTPVNWLSFYGVRSVDGIDLKWDVNESDNFVYDIERSNDGISYSKIGMVNALTDEGVLHKYTFTDRSPVAGNNFYRIKQTDRNGRTTYSSVITVNIKPQNTAWLIYPNPAKDIVYLKGDNIEPGTSLLFSDASGRVVKKFSFAENTGLVNISVNLQGLPKGFYTVKVITNDKVVVEKLLVE